VNEDWLDNCIEEGTILSAAKYFLANKPDKAETKSETKSAPKSKVKAKGISDETEEAVPKSKKSAPRTKKAKAMVESEEEVVSDEDEKSARKGKKSKKSAPRTKKAKAMVESEEEVVSDEDEKAARKGKKSKCGVFTGLVFCITGNFSRSQADTKAYLSENGAVVSNTVTGKVTHVLAEALGTSKADAGVSKGLPVVTEMWAQSSVEDEMLSTNPEHFLANFPGDANSSSKPAAKAKSEGKSVSKKRKPSAQADEENKDDEMNSNDDNEEEVNAKSGPPVKKLKTVTVKGKAPVDDVCNIASTVHIYEESACVWDATLNQTNIGQNNNKFYLIQLLQSDDNKKFYVWNRWGRVGATGQSALMQCSDLADAKKKFEGKFSDKTRNKWANRSSFSPVHGKYTLIERDYSVDDATEDAPEQKSFSVPDSKLPLPVQDLVKLICDVKMMTQSMIELGYDAEKLPLGKLSVNHVQKGYAALSEISVSLAGGKKDLMALSNKFYTLIPHAFGMKTPPVINTPKMLKEKMDMVASLADIMIATKLIKQGNTLSNPIDAQYEKLACDISVLDKKSEEFKLVDKYVKNTHGSTHTSYTLEILEVFKLERHGEEKRFSDWKGENRMLLWHGSRLTNYCGIISQGLRIAPPEAPVTGYMFGKGVYFADMISKSANYCSTNKANPIGCMLLCDVAVGSMNDKFEADYNADKLPAGTHSTRGVGKFVPNPAEYETLPDGLVVPCGRQMDVSSSLPSRATLQYNEFIVYKTEQVKMKYLLKLKFNHKF
jgi:poly [ADP-ribose] polymerase